MKFGVLALDYNGTIARDGVLDPGVRAAIGEVRVAVIVFVLVTGRILSDLRGLMGDLRPFDSVVAENEAVVAFPNNRSFGRIGQAASSLAVAGASQARN